MPFRKNNGGVQPRTVALLARTAVGSEILSTRGNGREATQAWRFGKKGPASG